MVQLMTNSLHVRACMFTRCCWVCSPYSTLQDGLEGSQGRRYSARLNCPACAACLYLLDASRVSSLC
jgi:hypothetical protein